MNDRIAKLEKQVREDGETIMQACKDLEEAARLLQWARGCVPFPSDCHSAIVKFLEARGNAVQA